MIDLWADSIEIKDNDNMNMKNLMNSMESFPFAQQTIHEDRMWLPEWLD